MYPHLTLNSGMEGEIMKDPDNRKYSRERKRPMRLQREGRFSEGRIFERSIEDDPAVERGERIATGKMIARGGKSSLETCKVRRQIWTMHAIKWATERRLSWSRHEKLREKPKKT